MRFMLLIYGDENTLDESARIACFNETAQLAHDLHGQGKFRATSPLHKTATAKSVRVREGKRVVTDGPFAETREQLGGYMIVDATDIDEAIEIASRIPGGRWGTVEVREIVELTNIPVYLD